MNQIRNSIYSFKERENIREQYKSDPIMRHPYQVKWKFSPLENICWGEIRCTYETRHFRPEYPIGKYFVDFADPINKVVLECDSKKFHSDKEKDKLRQTEIELEGWKVFRLTPKMILSNIYEEIILRKIDLEQYECEEEIQEEIEKYKNECIGCFFRSEQFRKLIKPNKYIPKYSDSDYDADFVKNKRKQLIELARYLYQEGKFDDVRKVIDQLE
jgi:very-short-patch-repair endonuclease